VYWEPSSNTEAAQLLSVHLETGQLRCDSGVPQSYKNLGATRRRKNIRHQRIKFIRHGDLPLGICGTLI